MKILYLDCPTGISGDMFLASLIDMGVSRRMLVSELKKLPVPASEINIRVGRAVRHSITGTTFHVKVKETHHHRTFGDIKKLISKSSLEPAVKVLATEIFALIAGAEAKVHGIEVDKVHFHEVGAMDSIIDIVGAAIAFTSLKVDTVYASPIPLGSGTARTMHGVIPVPAPATLEILKGVPTASSSIPFELTTPTGAAIVKKLAAGYGPFPAMVVEKTGYGAGKKDFREAANMLRAVTGTSAGDQVRVSGADTMVVLETNIDDMTPQVASYLMERLFEAGAAEVFFTPVQMKKSRPGILLTTIAAEENKQEILDIIFTESTSIGVRSYRVERHCLERKKIKVRTPYGMVGVKVSSFAGRVVNRQPEYEDARAIAVKKDVPISEVLEAAKAAARDK